MLLALWENAVDVTARIRRNGVVTIPVAVRQELNLAEGGMLLLRVEDGRLTVTPIPRDQEWFWTPQWQAKEREADEDLAAGRYTTYYSDEEFLASFDIE